jgi:cbb3-type cytochrome oxidase subunit 3
LFASLMLVVMAIVYFAWTVRERSHEHADRLAILPLQDDQQDPDPATAEEPHACR